MKNLLRGFLCAFLFFLPFLAEGKTYKYQLSIAAIFKNEAPYLKEWIEYHRIVGVQHFILYNNNSTDHFRDVLDPYVKSGIVELIEWPSIQKDKDWGYTYATQKMAYTNAIVNSKGVSKWLALIDLDEFIVPVHDVSIVDCLNSRYALEAGVCINWQCYGTSGIMHLDENIPMIAQLIRKLKWDHPWHKHSKSIVKPLKVSHCTNPHFCLYNPGYYGVDENHQATPNCPSTVSINHLRLNHYWTRDEWYFRKFKLPRYEKWVKDDTSETPIDIEDLLKIYDVNSIYNDETDDIMLRFVPALIEALKK